MNTAMSVDAHAPASVPALVDRWPSEIPLRVLVILASLGLWAALVLSIFGIVYVALIAVFLFFSHVAFITHVRGSAVRLGPQQFPRLWNRVVELSQQAGLAEPPEAYVMEAGGSLNAFATKLFRGRLMVLFTDLLDACGEDEAARDMVVGHELGHLKCGHLDWFLLTAPGRLFPFLGAAYSRACEHTCDRWGAALCGDPGGATRGLAILAAGGAHGPHVNLAAFVAQRESLDTGWMTIGRWLSGYPPLSARVEALAPALAGDAVPSSRGLLRALFILGSFVFVPSAIGIAAAAFWTAKMAPLLNPSAHLEQSSSASDSERGEIIEDPVAGAARVQTDFDALAGMIASHYAATGVLASEDELEDYWATSRDDRYPYDPFDGLSYGYSIEDEHTVLLFSSGPDAEVGTEDDIERRVEIEM